MATTEPEVISAEGGTEKYMILRMKLIHGTI